MIVKLVDIHIPAPSRVVLVPGIDSRIIPLPGRAVLVTGRVILVVGSPVPVASEMLLKLEKLPTTINGRVIYICS
jgi:hypothetical protein